MHLIMKNYKFMMLSNIFTVELVRRDCTREMTSNFGGDFMSGTYTGNRKVSVLLQEHFHFVNKEVHVKWHVIVLRGHRRDGSIFVVVLRGE